MSVAAEARVRSAEGSSRTAVSSSGSAHAVSRVASSGGSLLKAGISRRVRTLGQHHERLVSRGLEGVGSPSSLVIEGDTLLSLDGGRSQDGQGCDGGSGERDDFGE